MATSRSGFPCLTGRETGLAVGGGGECRKKLDQRHRVQAWVRIEKTALSSPRALMPSALFAASSYSGGNGGSESRPAGGLVWL